MFGNTLALALIIPSIYPFVCLFVLCWLVFVFILSTFRKKPCAVSIRSSMVPRLDCSHSPSWIVQNSTNRSVAMTVWPVEVLSRTFLMWCCLNTDSHFRVSGWNAHVWPFAWKLLTTIVQALRVGVKSLVLRGGFAQKVCPCRTCRMQMNSFGLSLKHIWKGCKRLF